MQFNSEQKQAITSLKPYIFVSAGAGSGKTRILTERFVYLCELRLLDEQHEAGATVDEIVAITFTEKAAREMRDRIRSRLAEKEAASSDERERFFWREQQEALERAHISTFHSFCQRLLSQHAMAADLLPQMRLLDELESKRMKRTILKDLLNERHFFEKALPILELRSKDQLIESLERIHSQVRELVIGEKAIENLEVDDMIAQQEKWKKREQLEIIQSFHSLAVRCIDSFPPVEGLTDTQRKHVERITASIYTLPTPTEIDDYMELVSEVMPGKIHHTWKERLPSLYELHGNWKELKEDWTNYGQFLSADETIRQVKANYIDLLKLFSAAYMDEKKRAGLLDFSDLQQKAVSLLHNQAIKKVCAEQFKHIMIDEFQDTNVLQLTMLEQINPKYQFIVGDQKQSIYRFRGADVSLMNEKEEELQTKEQAEIILMNKNYRTQAPIIQGINELFSYVMASERSTSYETVYTPLEANRVPENEKEKRIELMILPKEQNEKDPYEVLADRIAQMIRTGKPLIPKEDEWAPPAWSDIAILIPSRTNLMSLERALTNLRIPYIVNGGVGFFERQEIIDFLTLLRWLNRPFEDVHLLALLRSPLLGLTLEDFFKMKELLHDHEQYYELAYNEQHPSSAYLSEPVAAAFKRIRTWLNRWTPFRIHASVDQTLHEIFLETDLRSALFLQPNGLQKVRNVEKLIELIVQMNAADLETIVAELTEIEQLSKKEGEAEVEDAQGNLVQIMTIHASKGLEFPIVCLPQLERALVKDNEKIRFSGQFGIVFDMENKDGEKFQSPGFSKIKKQADAEALEESKRLLYVAMTRARDYLLLAGEESVRKQTWLSFLEPGLSGGNLEAYIEAADIPSEQEPMPLPAYNYKLPKVIEENSCPITLSVSEIVLFINDPVQYFNRFVIGMPQNFTDVSLSRSTASEGVDPSLLGTLVHRACELRDIGYSISVAATEAMTILEEVQNKSLYEKELIQLMQNYSDEQREQLGEPLANEWSFEMKLEGVEIIGEIDKVVKRDGACHVIDFKTNRIRTTGAEWLSYYRPQLYLYKLAYEQLQKKQVDSMALYTLRDQVQPLHVIEPEQDYENNLRATIQQIKRLREQRAGKNEYERLATK